MSSTVNLIPTHIEPHNDHEMKIAWNAGDSYALSYEEMRFQCPCAGCVDEHTGKRTLKREAIRKDIKPKGVELIGRYAISVAWNDNHSSGMLNFDRLRSLCEEHGKLLESAV